MKMNRLDLSVNLVLKPLSVAGAWYMLHNLHYTLLHPTNNMLIMGADIVFLLLSLIWSYVIMDKLETHGAWGWVLLLGGLMGATYSITAYAEHERAYTESLALNSVYMEAKKLDEATYYSEVKKNNLKARLTVANKKVTAFLANTEEKLREHQANYSEQSAEAMLISLKRNDKEAYLDKVDDVSGMGYKLTSPLALARALENEEIKRLKNIINSAKNSEAYQALHAKAKEVKASLLSYTPESVMVKKMELKQTIENEKVKTEASMLFDLDMLLKIWLAIGLVLEIFGSPLAMWLNLATANKETMSSISSTIVEEEDRINGIISSLCSQRSMKEIAEKHELLKQNGEVQSFYAALFNYIVFAIDKEYSFSEVPVISKNNREDTAFLHGWSLQNPKSQTQKTVRLKDGSVYTPFKSSPSKFTVEIKELLAKYEPQKINMDDVENIILLKKSQKIA